MARNKLSRENKKARQRAAHIDELKAQKRKNGLITTALLLVLLELVWVQLILFNTIQLPFDHDTADVVMLIIIAIVAYIMSKFFMRWYDARKELKTLLP